MSAKRKRPHSESEITFDGACLLLETILNGDTRQRILTDLSKSRDFTKALLRLRDSMRRGVFKADSDHHLDRIIKTFDRQTAQDGFHVLHDWDGNADKLNEDIIPLDVLHYILRGSGVEPATKNILAILLDYYFVYVLALLSLRVWSEGDVDDNLDRLSQLLRDLQGPAGSGQKFAENAETLILIATSHFEPDINAYERLLAKVKILNPSHQARIALVHAAILASHLRHGLQGLYGKDIASMRDDNVPDYPWLCFSLATLMKAYARMHDENIHGIEREKIVEGILNGLSPDARAFVGKPPVSLSAYEAERSHFRELFHRYKQDLFHEFELHRPSDRDYSPMSFTFNFPHNLLKAVVVDALLRGEPWNLTLNDLLTGVPRGEQIGQLRERLARTLMAYANASPEMVRGRAVPAISYDPYSGLRNFAKTIGIIKERNLTEKSQSD